MDHGSKPISMFQFVLLCYTNIISSKPPQQKKLLFFVAPWLLFCVFLCVFLLQSVNLVG